MRLLSRALTVLFFLSGTCAFGQTDFAHFWLSTSATDPVVGEAPQISIGNEVPGMLYIWGRPKESEILTAFSLNVVTKLKSGTSPAINLLDDEIHVFNRELTEPRFQYERDSTAQCDLEVPDFCVIPAIESEAAPPLSSEDAVLNLAGFTIWPSTGPTGIGSTSPDACDETNSLCFTASDDKKAWLIASVGYESIATGETSIYLQIGELGMQHQGEPANLTKVKFGDSGGPLYCAGAGTLECSTQQRDTTLSGDSADATIFSSLPGDFEPNNIVEQEDLEKWQGDYGELDVDLPGGNGNGIVDGGDFLIWQRNLGRRFPSSAAIRGIPEPVSSLLLAELGVIAFILSRHRPCWPASQLDPTVGIKQSHAHRSKLEPSRVFRSCHVGLPIAVRCLLFTAGIFFVAHQSALAQSDIFWNAAGQDQWHLSGNWSPAIVPTSPDSAVIDNGGTAIITQSVLPVANLEIVSGATFLETNGSLSVDDLIDVGLDGELRVVAPLAQLSSNELHNSGAVFLESGTSLSTNSFSQASGITMLVGGATLGALTTEILGGSLSGGGILQGDVTVGTDGTLTALQAGVLRLTGQLTNFDSGTNTLTDGNYVARGTLRFPDANIVTNSANISLITPGSAITDHLGNDALGNFAANTAGARFALSGNRDLIVPSHFQNAGAVVLANSTFTVSGDYTQTGGFTELRSGGHLEAATVNLNGILRGTGTITGDLTSDGTLSPGLNAPGSKIGTLTIDGDATFSSSNSLVIDIAGINSGEFDTLDFSGDLSVGGEVVFDLSDASTLQVGDTVEFLTANNLQNLNFNKVRTIGSVDLVAVPIYTPGFPGKLEAAMVGLGDMNQDDTTDADDIPFFALALFDKVAYRSACEAASVHPSSCDYGTEVGDWDGSGELDFDDIGRFADYLDSTEEELFAAMLSSLSKVPEPSSVVSLVLGLCLFANRFPRARSLQEIDYALIAQSTGRIDV